jgi:hypothetical protein
MATTKLSDEEFLAFLEKHPDLRDRFASIVSAVENSEGNLKEADAAEERIVEEMRLLGREAMQGWAGGGSRGDRAVEESGSRRPDAPCRAARASHGSWTPTEAVAFDHPASSTRAVPRKSSNSVGSVRISAGRPPPERRTFEGAKSRACGPSGLRPH